MKKFITSNYHKLLVSITIVLTIIHFNFYFWEAVVFGLVASIFGVVFSKKNTAILAFILILTTSISMYLIGNRKHIYLIETENKLISCEQRVKDFNIECLKQSVNSESGKYIKHTYLGRGFVK